jgi:hypothetical protein
MGSDNVSQGRIFTLTIVEIRPFWYPLYLFKRVGMKDFSSAVDLTPQRHTQ